MSGLRRSEGAWQRRVAFLVALTAGALLAGCTDPAPSPVPSTAPATLTPQMTTPAPETANAEVVPAGDPVTIADSLETPWSVVFVGTTALVSERDSGRILELADDGSVREVGVVPGVVRGGSGGFGAEGGLLGLAVDGSGRLYVYSTGEGGNRIQRFTLTGAPGSYGLGQAETLLDGLQSAVYHNGGRIAFGPDGMLYAAVGDASQSGNAQDLGSLNGKILRMSPDGDVPADNPFAGSLVYSYGHRNVQGLAWGSDGTMYATEFGQNTWDELNIIVPGGNYGWPQAEGVANAQGFIDPVQQWAPNVASPSGMVAIGGTLFLANLAGQVLRAVPIADPSVSIDYYQGAYGRIRDVANAPDGSLWLVTSNTDGRGDPAAGDDRILRVELLSDAADRTPDEEASVSAGTAFQVIIGGAIFEGTLGDTPTARDLTTLLPLTLEFRDLNSVEKIAPLPRALTMEGVPAGDDPEPQDIGYYEPTGNLVLYYGDVGYWDGIVRLGTFDTDLSVLVGLTGTFTATVQLAE